MSANIPQSGKMISPKERAMISTIIPALNPINPIGKLQKLLDKTVLPSRSYFTSKMRGAKLTSLGLDNLLYIYMECKQCSSELKLLAKIQYYIVWYKEILEDGDQEDLDAYETCFREDFKMYQIDFSSIFTEPTTIDTPPEPQIEPEPIIIDEPIQTPKQKFGENRDCPMCNKKKVHGFNKNKLCAKHQKEIK